MPMPMSRSSMMLLALASLIMMINPNHFTATPFTFSAATTTHTAVIQNNKQNNDDKNNKLRTTSISDSNSNSNIIHVPWLIVGGGIHGVHIAARLLAEHNTHNTNNNNDNNNSNSQQNEFLCIVDDNEHLLQKWKTRTAATGMEYLRSSVGYHLDLDENSLRNHLKSETMTKSKGTSASKKKGGRGARKNKTSTSTSPLYTNDYKRPRLDVFNQHCDHVVTKYNLDRLHQRGIVTDISFGVDVDSNDHGASQSQHDYIRVVVSLPPEQDGDENENGQGSHQNKKGSSSSSRRKEVVYKAERIVLALGNDQPSYAEWVEDEDIQNGFVRHLLDDTRTHTTKESQSQSKLKPAGASSVAIVGGGITAAHKALEILQANKRNKMFGSQQNTSLRQQSNASTTLLPNSISSNTNTIHLISRHPLREQQFDTHQEWMMDRAACKRSEEGGGSGMPKRQTMFNKCTCLTERRRTIAKERIAGTVTPAISRGKDGLRYAIENGDVIWHQAEVLKKRYIDVDGMYVSQDEGEHDDEQITTVTTRVELSLSCGETIEVDEVLLATGFGKRVPGGKMIQHLVSNANLQVSDFCGYPIVNEDLSWNVNMDSNVDLNGKVQTQINSRIYVAGALAELELGPSARNIAGARLAAERIVQSQLHSYY
jgi:hypothetical protein